MTKNLSRRTFLLGAAAGAAAVAVVPKKPAPQAVSGSRDRRATRGYHASEHIDNYYRTTTV